jgi:hypothetical protein
LALLNGIAMGPGYLFGGLVWVWVWGLRESDQRSVTPSRYGKASSLVGTESTVWVDSVMVVGATWRDAMTNKMVLFPVYIV